MRPIILTALLLLLTSATVFAHDGSDHASELEQWVAGIGMILILLSCIYSFWWKRPDTHTSTEYDHFSDEPNSENIS